jgi:putative ABC transport system permease protein
MSRGVRIFRRLLRLFPAEFRGDFGDDMTRTFEDHHDEVAARGGVIAHVRLWIDTVLGILMTAPREHWDLLRQDIRYGVRSLGRNPGFATVALLALGLGVGATTAVFSVVNSVLLQPLPYRSADRLVRLIENVPARESVTGQPERIASMATDEFTEWRGRMRTLSHMGMYGAASMTLIENGRAVRLRGARVSPSIFPMLGLQPAMGRLFEPGEEGRGADAVAIVAHRTWQRHLGGDSSILRQHRSITLDGRAYSIVGVMGPDASFPDPETEFWIPFVPLDLQTGRVMRAAMIARLADDATIESAEQEANATGAPLRPRPQPDATATAAAAAAAAAARPRFEIVRVHDQLVAPVRPALRMLMAASAAVLLIACANVANLLLARNTTRRREMAIRGALGASRIRLARQALTEHLVLALAGWTVGLALAYGGVSLVATLAAAQGPSWLASFGGSVLPRVDDLGIDGSVLAFSLAAAGATALLFGLGPVVHQTRVQYTHAIAEATAAAASGLSLFSRQRRRAVLVVAQLGMATVLLIGAGLLIRSFVKLASVDTGYEPNDVLTFQAVLPPGRTEDPRRPVFATELTRRLRDLPRVQLAGFTNILPLTTGRFVVSFTIPGVAPEATTADVGSRPQTRYVSQDYLRAIGVRLVEGRWFGDRDDATGAKVVLVNQALARRFFGDRSPVGTFVTLGNTPWEIVGVVGDVRQGGLDTDAEPQWFIDFRQLTQYVPAIPHAGGVFFAVRTSDDPVAMVSTIRAIARQIESQAALDNVYALDALVSAALARPRFYAILMGLFASAAAALAAIGIYGVLAYAVARRTREIGIRMALGAPRRRVLWLVLGQGAGLTLTGILFGVAGAVLLTRYLRTMLFGLTPLDPPTFLGVSIVFAGIAALACYVPARRAMAVDPLTALREE